MSFVIPALISAASAAAGGYAAYRGGRQQASSARDVMREQMDFQREMSNTAIRRHMNDLREAGLNPILAYGSLGGASTPAGASYTPQNYVGEAVNSASSAARSSHEMLQMQMFEQQLEAMRLQNINLRLDNEAKRNQVDILGAQGKAALGWQAMHDFLVDLFGDRFGPMIYSSAGSVAKNALPFLPFLVPGAKLARPLKYGAAALLTLLNSGSSHRVGSARGS